MASLIENILSIEHQANEVVAKAHAESKAMEKEALAEIQRVRQEIEAQTEQRIDDFRKDAEQKHQATLSAEKEEAARHLAGLDRLEPALVQKLAGTIVTKFREQ